MSICTSCFAARFGAIVLLKLHSGTLPEIETELKLYIVLLFN